MGMCVRCKKRMAVIYIARIEGDKTFQEGICMKCAKELGLPVENMFGNTFDKLGITPDQLESMEDEITSMIQENGGLPSDSETSSIFSVKGSDA